MSDSRDPVAPGAHGATGWILPRPTRKRFLADGAGLIAALAVSGSATRLGCDALGGPVSATPGPAFEPAYVKLLRAGELRARGDRLYAMMQPCRLCPRECGTARLDAKRGFCGASARVQVASHHPHFGEERPLVGRGGSGTIFFTHCSLRCVFCINAEISHGGEGETHTVDELAAMMLRLQAMGCHNINVVTPTHYSAHIVLALDRAAARGLRLPIVYNTAGWERPEVLSLLDGVVDIYLPDLKYADARMADTYSAGASTYPEVTRAAILEMHRQVGVARPGPDGLIRRGLMIRHLVMPNGVSGTDQAMAWIGTHLPSDTYVNVMGQYRPAFRASEFAPIARRLTRAEYDGAVQAARRAGLTQLDLQGYR